MSQGVRTRRQGRRRQQPFGLSWAAGLLLSISFTSPQSWAAASASEKAVAETLFDEGRELMAAGKFSEACPKLEQSQATESAIGTMLYLAECYEKTNRLASAWAMFREAASRAEAEGQADRAELGAERAERIEPLLSKLTIAVNPENTMPGLIIKLDGNELPKALHGAAIPIDAGDHTISAEAPEHESWSTHATVPGPSATASIEVPALKKAAEPTPAEPATPAAANDALGPSSDAAFGTEGISQQTWGLALGGVGVVGLGLGVFFGLEAADADSRAEGLCPRSEPCNDQQGLDLTEDAKDAALYANIAYGVGGAALIAGAVLFLTAGDEAPSAAASMPQLELGSARVSAEPILGDGFSGLSINGAF